MPKLYIDMDGTLVDFEAGIPSVTEEQKERYGEDYDDIPGFFDDLPPIEGGIDAFRKLSQKYDTYILSTAPWNNHTAWSAKNFWVRRYLPNAAHKRLILSHNKHLVRREYLSDDREAHRVNEFPGEHIHFRSERFPDWDAVLDYLL